MPTAFLGMLGDDEDGEFYKAKYEEMGGDTSRFSSTSSCHHGRCLSLVTPDSQRTMRTDLGAAATLSPDSITIEKFQDIQHVHIEGYIIFNEPLTRQVLKLAKQAGCSVSLDLASFEVVNATRSILPSLLEYVDIVFANEDEGAAFCGTDDQDHAIELLSRYCDIAVLKLGKEGSIVLKNGEKIQIKPELATAIDTTGAGDLWQAGFLYGVLNGLSLEDAGAYGSILGAEVVQVMGAVIPDETWTKIKTKIKTN
jgi:sugar/nucleoside kinase (ribokinase family)